jgi:hypothetical protein
MSGPMSAPPPPRVIVPDSMRRSSVPISVTMRNASSDPVKPKPLG